MDDVTLVKILTASFQKQVQWYRELLALDQKALNALVLSRGGIPVIVGLMDKKTALLDDIVRERESVASPIALWRERKATLAGSPFVSELNAVLAQTESVISEFLNCEDQLRRYLSHLSPNRVENAQ